jgi:hypothetical protein
MVEYNVKAEKRWKQFDLLGTLSFQLAREISLRWNTTVHQG